MFESIDIIKRNNYNNNENNNHNNNNNKSIVYLFIIISASYMLPWTAVGSLLHYFAGHYGDKYFVYLNCAFYGIGLPLSYSQKKFDIFFDTLYGSKYMFRRRLWISMSLLFLCLLFGPICGEFETLLLVGIIGLCTWSSHGCATTLASIIKMNSSTMQQIGFAFPGIISLILVQILNMEGDVSLTRLRIFYWTTAALVLPGIIAWIILCRSDIVRSALEGKDQIMSNMIIQTANSVKGDERIVKYQNSNSLYNPIHGDDYDSEGQYLHSNSFLSLNKSDNISITNTKYPPISLQDDSSKSTNTTNITNTINDNIQGSTTGPLLQQLSSQNLLLNESKQLLLSSPELLEIAIYSEPIEDIIYYHRWTLFLTLFISILQGSLLSYTCGCTLFGMALPPLLYFIRIFSDLLGRPLALLPKPSFFQTIRGVFIGSILRVIASFYFFYVIHTISPHESLLKNTFEQSFSLCVFQVIFSGLSGYLNCLTYEYSSSSFTDNWQRLVAAQYLNLTFQKACATGVITAISIVMIIQYANPCRGIHHTSSSEPCI